MLARPHLFSTALGPHPSAVARLATAQGCRSLAHSRNQKAGTFGNASLTVNIENGLRMKDEFEVRYTMDVLFIGIDRSIAVQETGQFMSHLTR